MFHLFVLLTDLSVDNDYVWVSISSIKPNKAHDDTCTFKGAEHPRIVKPSFVYYRKAETVNALHLKKMCDKADFKHVEDMNDADVQRMLAGIGASKQSPPFVRTSINNFKPKPEPAPIVEVDNNDVGLKDDSQG